MNQTPRQVWLVRHAQAQGYGAGQGDAQRELSAHGLIQARTLGAYFVQAGIVPQRIVASDAMRTTQTAQVLAHMTAAREPVLPVLEESLYLANAAVIWDCVQQTPDAVQTLMVVGHNPGISNLAARFVPNLAGMQTGWAIGLDFTAAHWRAVSLENCVHHQIVDAAVLADVPVS